MAYSDALRQLYATFNSAADLIDGVLSGSTDYTSFKLKTADPVLIIQDTETGSASANARVRLAESDGAGAVDNYYDIRHSGVNLTIERNGTEYLRVIDGGDVTIGRTTTVYGGPLSVGVDSGSGYVESISSSLANDQNALLIARGTVGANHREAWIGVRKHSGITNAVAYIGLDAEDAAENYLWVDNSDQLRISTTITHIGTTSGTVVGTQTSDERLKNIKPAPFAYGLADILQLDPIEYALKDDPTRDQLGFSAQQVRPILPETVFDTGCPIEGEDPNQTKLGMDYSQIIPVLVQAIKELTARIEILENA